MSFDRLREETAATPRDVARLRSFIEQRLHHGGAIHLPGTPRPPPGRHRPVMLAVAAVVALAAGALLFMRPAPSRPVSAEFAAVDGWSEFQIDPGIDVVFQGAGRLGGTNRAPVIEWDRGRVRVVVDHPVDLAVHTREATVRVTGTIFEVTRDALGTRVTVERGSVALQCGDGSARAVTAPGKDTCLPQTAGGMLGRARTLQDAHAPVADVLSSVQGGLALASPDSPVRGELLLLRIESLVAQGNYAEAFADAQAYLALPSPLREARVQRMAADLALSLGGCEQALPYLRAVAQDSSDPEDQRRLDSCTP